MPLSLSATALLLMVAGSAINGNGAWPPAVGLSAQAGSTSPGVPAYPTVAPLRPVSQGSAPWHRLVEAAVPATGWRYPSPAPTAVSNARAVSYADRAAVGQPAAQWRPAPTYPTQQANPVLPAATGGRPQYDVAATPNPGRYGRGGQRYSASYPGGQGPRPADSDDLYTPIPDKPPSGMPDLNDGLQVYQ